MDFAEKVGERVRTLRISQGLRQEDLAARSRITRTHLSRIERGQVNMRMDNLEAICEGLSVQPDEIMRGVKISGV